MRLWLLSVVLVAACAPPPPAPPAPAIPPTRPVRHEPPPPLPPVVPMPIPAPAPAAPPMDVAQRLEMRSTAYCLRGSMRTGVRTRNGMAATDPTVIPLGSVLRVTHRDGRLLGLFVAMDTGGAIHGSKIDLYMESCHEASDWGVQPVVVEVLRIGWSR
jgi:3D (Asp-Asp-Asp) domain-containing protein